MNALLHLTISTPADVTVERDDVRAIRTSDESGSFGILPGHADFLTVLPSTVVRWRDGEDRLSFCAVKGGVLSVAGGNTVRIAAREALLGERLEDLEASIHASREEAKDMERKARVDQMRLHAQAVRQLMHYLSPEGSEGFPALLGEDAP